MSDMSVATSAEIRLAEPQTVFEGMTVFHEDWWLEAACGGAFRKLTVVDSGRTVGFMPIYTTKSGPFTRCQMPPLTHVLGAVVDLNGLEHRSQVQRRFKITRELLNQLPAADLFRQVVDAGVPDVLAYQAAGLQAKPHYTIVVDCSDLDAAFAGFSQMARRTIRKAQKSNSVIELDDPERFQAFYEKNLGALGRSSTINFGPFSAIYAAVRAHDAGRIFAVLDENGALGAAIFVVWGHGRLYYLLTTRDPGRPDHGLVGLLIWRAMHEAHARNLVLDLDGIASEPVFHFLSGFGGRLATRMIVQRRSWRQELTDFAVRRLRRQPEPSFY